MIALGPYVLLLAVVTLVQPRTTYDLEHESHPRQYIRHTTILGHRLPQNATKLEVCFKSAADLETCDIYNSTASFSAYAQPRPEGLVRLFRDEIGRAKKNIFSAQEIIVTLMNDTNDHVQTQRFSGKWIEHRVKRDVIVLGIVNETHPNVHSFLTAYNKYEVTRDDSRVRDFIVVAVRMEIFCLKGYFGEQCTEHCPQGCTHGTCSNGTCSDCDFPYHGEACDRCGTNGDCKHGQCKLSNEGDLLSGQCVCHLPYEGAQCDSLINNCSIVPCSPHGKCNLNTFKCICIDNRFEGNFCEIYSYWGSMHSLVDGSMCIILLMFLVAGAIRIKLLFMRSPCEDAFVELREKCMPPEKQEADYQKQLLNEVVMRGLPSGQETHL